MDDTPFDGLDGLASLQTHVKWLLQVADAARKQARHDWANTCEDAANAIDRVCAGAASASSAGDSGG